ncbi:lantibiotic ABC transporter permease [Chryseotalea sanaruensis]|uniref:Lantibiotic ABC transporter permease n=1 Tax=Chryseotalea sanaruensis TaxID=2482724 RepID=A0A401U8L9_9BACT|nr:tryptophan-rich sensory protein [Chryseotalea sanaruensis]GCC51230.1 lantibiotic ABC transporter permease [Chryseotalea sanaruensis]
MKSTKYNAFLTTVAFIATITANALANILPINGLNTGEVSALYPSLFTPAGITFSIWSVIYLLLLGYVVLQWLKSDAYVFAETAKLFWISCLLNISWIFAWHYLKVSISVTIMLLLLLTLAQLFLKVRKISMNTVVEKVFVRLPFTLYFAWICVATIANISALLVSIQWPGLNIAQATWAIIMMTVAALLGIFVTTKYRVAPFAIVIAWALFGIYVKWQGTDNYAIAYAALSLLLIVLGSAFNTWRRLRFAVL